MVRSVLPLVIGRIAHPAGYPVFQHTAWTNQAFDPVAAFVFVLWIMNPRPSAGPLHTAAYGLDTA